MNTVSYNSLPGVRRYRQHGSFTRGFKFSQRADPFAARELVDLGRDDVSALDRRLQPSPGLDVARQAWVPRVHQQECTQVWYHAWVLWRTWVRRCAYIPNP